MQGFIYKTTIFIHVICGISSLIAGAIAMATKKGGRIHNVVGLIFYGSMSYIFFSSIVFFILEPSNLKYQFFLGIGIVSFYPNWSGKRMLKYKKSFEPTLIDRIGAILIGIAGLGMLAYGGYLTVHPEPKYGGVNILFFIFGNVALTNCYGDVRAYFGYRKIEKMHWFFAHGGKMMGAYSAAMTAFCVNILPRYLPAGTPGFVQIMTWVVPGVTIGIIGNLLLRKYRLKFSKQ
ncbi:MAG: hypothetical protein ACRCVT_09970 [Leadbetterella sp.]